ncbi:MAG: hypothetical protein QME58_01640 [Bacteroidota bacterium]|nr:hypothetical protein [Bacteroidota bacterium]
MYRLFLILVALFFLILNVPSSFAMGDSLDFSYFEFSMLRTGITMPEKYKLVDPVYHSGFGIGSSSNVKIIDEIEIGPVGKLCLNLGRDLLIGFTSGKMAVNSTPVITDTSFKYPSDLKSPHDVNHLTGILDLYSLNVNAEYHLPLLGERALIGQFAVTFFNIGGTISYMKEGVFKDKFFGVVNLLPFYIQPSVKLKLKGATIGIGLLINPYSFLEYRFGPEHFYAEEEKGVKSSSAQITKYALQIFLRY